MDQVISVRDLSKTYQLGEHEVHALRSVSLDVGRGEFVSVIGPSGSGKSTLMHILGCLDQPTKGQYLLDGKDVSRLSDDEVSLVRNEQIGFVFQGFNLLTRTSALENVELPLLYGKKDVGSAQRRKQAMEALAAVGLEGRWSHHTNQLSGGQQQRVAIARALLNNPSILLADEPTGNLDTKNSAAVLEMLLKSNRELGQTTLMITHNPEAASIAGRILTMRDGEIVGEERGSRPDVAF